MEFLSEDVWEDVEDMLPELAGFFSKLCDGLAEHC